jgi:WD40 repeat protein
MSISPDGSTVVSGGLDGLVCMWNAANGARTASLAAESGRVRRASFDPSGTFLVVGGQWRTRVWNMRDPVPRPRDLGGSDPVSDFHISPDGRRVVTANGGSGQLRMWDLSADARVHRWAARGQLIDLAVADDGRTIVAAGLSGVSMLEAGGAAQPTHSATGRVHAVDVSADNRWIVTVGPPGTSGVWNREMRRVADLPADRSSRAVAFADNDRRIIVGLSSGEVRSWDWSDGRALNPRTLATGDGEVVALAVHGRTLHTAHGSRAIVMRDISTGREIRRMVGASVPFSIAVTPDGRILAAGTYLSATDLWDTQTGQRVAELKGQTAMIAGVDVSPDGTLIASASRDGSTRLWSVRGQLLTTVATRSFPAERVRFLPDRRRLAIVYADGEVEIRDLDYYFRYAAGQAEYQLRLLRQAGESFPRAHEVLAWSRRVLSTR